MDLSELVAAMDHDVVLGDADSDGISFYCTCLHYTYGSCETCKLEWHCSHLLSS